MPLQPPSSPDPSAESTTRTSPVRRPFDSLGPDDIRVVPALLRNEAVGGALMLAATVVALLWANAAPAAYEHVRHLHVGPLTLQHWAADGLLTVFFFVAGLELKRELTSGSLARPREALVPIVAAVTGMAVPAALYALVNLAHGAGHVGGWAIPMATDIAFAMAILAVVGRGLPASLRAFLLTLAIVDDLGAILVIATVFTQTIHLPWLTLAVACALAWWLLQRRRVDHPLLFVPLFLVTWWAMLQSGVHATIAGVALGLATRSAAAEQDDPVDRWSHFWHPISACLVVPVFAVLSAGVVVDACALRAVVTQPVGLGILAGLLLGKPLGILGGAWLTARFTRAELAEPLRWSDVGAVSVLAGVGFTVALFVSELAFADEALTAGAKAAVLVGSVVASGLATVALRLRVRRRAG